MVSKRTNGNETLAAVLQHRMGSDTEALENVWQKRWYAVDIRLPLKMSFP